MTAYMPRRASASRFVVVRGLRYHLREWGDARLSTPARPSLWMLHGWMDVGASFQFLVDAMADGRHIVAPDWRGFGLTGPAGADTYWPPDYLGDLDALLQQEAGTETAIDLAGHSLGGNVAMVYAGVRPQRVRRLVNMEGFGLPATDPDDAPGRIARWLDGLRDAPRVTEAANVDAVADRLRRNNPLLRADFAAWLAPHWASPVSAGDAVRWQIQGDPVHKRSAPMPYQVDEVLACWRRITAPMLWIEGDRTEGGRWWGDNYGLPDFHRRLDAVRQVERHVVGPASHMLHHDQPDAIARLVQAFLDR